MRHPIHRAFGGAGPHSSRRKELAILSDVHGSCSSMAERSPVKRVVAGSSPVRNPVGDEGYVCCRQFPCEELPGVAPGK